MTEKLYDKDSYLFAFEGIVESCRPDDSRYAVKLDRTAFFPEGGGQYADTGMLNGAVVLDVQEVEGEIVHYTDQPLSVGEIAHGVLDADKRFSRMQNHSGEHIVSGIVHRLFGYDNVGFHLGDDDVTVDYNGVLTREDLDRVEQIANGIVTQNIKITAEYPDPETLATLAYRSKLELTENVRIVTIGQADCCACCAPHVARTGEIGAIRLLDFERYKGGVRCHMLCGSLADANDREKYKSIHAISGLLRVPQKETEQAVERLLESQKQKEFEIVGLRQRLAEAAVGNAYENGCICFFADALCDADSLRRAVNAGMQRAALCAGFLPIDGGFRYCIGSGSVDLRANARTINDALQGRGGGQSSMIQGTANAGRAQIESFFQNFSF